MKLLFVLLVFGLAALGLCQVHPDWKPYLKLDKEARVGLVRVLGTGNSRETLHLLVAALIDPEVQVVETAFSVLKSHKRPQTFHELIANMPVGSQYHAGLLLAEYKDPKYVRQLIKLLQHERIEVRRPVAMALGIMRNPAAFDPLLKALDDSVAEMRDEALRALRRFDSALYKAKLERRLRKS